MNSNQRRYRSYQVCLRTARTMLVCAVLGSQLVQAQSYKVLYSFEGSPDGALPAAALIQDTQGNLYGTTDLGGTSGCGSFGQGCGAVFKLTKIGKESVEYAFTGGNDGVNPYYAGVVRDTQGNLYGTTFEGGAFGEGIVFKLNKTGKETVLFNFCSRSGCTDGGAPEAGVIHDADGNLYGTTTGDGAFGFGTIFKISKGGKEVVLHSFRGYPNDGNGPVGGAIQDPQGNLYGTTYYGGKGSCSFNDLIFGCGTVFKVDTSGKETVLYNFKGGADGFYPNAGLIQDARGNLYGTTISGGNGTPCGSAGCGTVFKLTKTGRHTVLHSFAYTDGSEPTAGVIQDAKENLYGTTSSGGDSDYGTVFKLSKTGKETLLYNFCSQSGCADGAYPSAGVIRDSKGNLYGTTSYGGSLSCSANLEVPLRGTPVQGCGTVFKIVP
jgi:uncharacterized repeat protein (TIGR03803 family)